MDCFVPAGEVGHFLKYRGTSVATVLGLSPGEVPILSLVFLNNPGPPQSRLVAPEPGTGSAVQDGKSWLHFMHRVEKILVSFDMVPGM